MAADRAERTAESFLGKGWKKIASILLSMDFAIMLFIWIAILSAAGSLLPQQQPPGFYIEQFGLFWGTLWPKTGLTTFYLSPFFLGLLGLLSLCLLLCLWVHLQRFIRLILHRKKNHIPLTPTYFIATISFIFIHTAFLLVLIGAALDTNWIARLQQEGAVSFFAESRTDTTSFFPDRYRGRMRLHAQDRKAEISWVNHQHTHRYRLPFSVELEELLIRYDAHYQPYQYVSRLSFYDHQNKLLAKRNLSVNQPIEFQGLTFYQTAVSYAGTEFIFHAHRLDSSEVYIPSIELTAGKSIPFGPPEHRQQLSIVEYRPVNAIADHPQSFQALGSRTDQLMPSGIDNLGPSVHLTLQSEGQPTIELHQFLKPILIEGRAYWISGIQHATSPAVQYWRIPKLENVSLEDFFRLRKAFFYPENRQTLAQKMVSDQEIALSDSKGTMAKDIEGILSFFAAQGLEGMLAHIQQEGDPEKQETIRSAVTQLLQSAVLAAFDEKPHLGVDDINDLLISLSMSRDYASEWFLETVFWRERPATIIEVSRQPGQYWIFNGFILFLIGFALKWWIKRQN